MGHYKLYCAIFKTGRDLSWLANLHKTCGHNTIKTTVYIGYAIDNLEFAELIVLNTPTLFSIDFYKELLKQRHLH